MSRFASALLATTWIAGSTFAAQADVKVVASIKPVHSLVAAVMEGIGTPGLIVEGAGSPHSYALKPSQARMLEQADVVFWIGHELEAFLEKPLETVASRATSVELVDASGLVKLGFREGGAFEPDEHDEHEADHDEDHETAERDEHGHDDEQSAEADDDDHGHAHGAFDAHVWLDPANAKAMVREIGEVLAKADPDNAEQYETNVRAVEARLDALTSEVTEILNPVRGKGFVVFHDAYQYFEKRFGIVASGSLTVSPEVMPGAERLTEIREKVKELGATCIFAEPQFESRLIAAVAEGTSARSGVIDPLGASLEDGAALYFSTIRNMAISIRDCLSEAS